MRARAGARELLRGAVAETAVLRVCAKQRRAPRERCRCEGKMLKP